MVTGKVLMTSRRLRQCAFRLGMKLLLSIGIGLALAVTVPAEAMGQSARTAYGPACDRQADSNKNWRWPIQGQVMLGYNPTLPGRKGIMINGKPRQAVRAARGGRVVYV